jgi:methylenetetrahydrofolate--tRNA-(uracil-5-)-methyltransferase
MVGFQTRLTQGAQREVFRMIPGLAGAEFLRYGSIHRNTYIDSPSVLNPDLSARSLPSCFCAGQLCGNEGYTESIATGHMAALSACARIHGCAFSAPPATTACGALLRHITASPHKPFVPSGINFGLIDSITAQGGTRIDKAQKRRMLCERALADMQKWRDTCMQT